MSRIRTALATLISMLTAPTLALAQQGFTRPIPQPQSATAEWWFFAASVSFVLALVAVHLLVRRR
ncbi:protein NnrT [Pararhodobacter oceanensis]|uniref:protein NnrT n=1 Tax=Pararhodobacter oceanensis TaxID=2172121 RepID=UPI003A942A81